MSSYMDLHLTYTVPVIGALTLITLPFINRWELSKIAFISALALVYTTPCYNYNIVNGARTYSPERVSGISVRNVPVEECGSVVLHIVLTSLWALLCLRWRMPFLNFNHDMRSYQLIRWVPILALIFATATGSAMAVPGRDTFYLGSILFWASPATVVMWYGAGNYFVRNIRLSAIAIAVPALYLFRINRIAIRDGVWHVNRTTCLNVSVAGLPLEEALFAFVTTTMVVLAGTCYDKAYGMIVTFSQIFPHQFSISRKFFGQMFQAFVTPEYCMPSVVTEDLKKCIKVLDNSNIFGTSVYLFHIGTRLDLIIVYALGRITDNMIDDISTSSAEKRKLKLKLGYKFVKELFSDRKSDYDVKSIPHEADIDWTEYESVLSDDELASFRALARIAFFLPRKPFEELLAGYDSDMGGTLYRNENDLLTYSNNVAGSFGAVCVYIIMYRYDIDRYEFVEKDDFLIKKSYQIGNGLQFVNIARDLVNDSEKLGRCYLPTEYMDDEIEEVRILCKEKNPRSLGNKKLKRYADTLIKIADKHQSESVDAIKCLPRELRGLILTSVEVYRGLIDSIQSSPSFPNKAKLSKLHKCMIILNGLYIKSMQYVI